MRAIILMMCLLGVQSAHADDVLDRRQYFEISAQGLNTALVEFARQAKVEVSADGELLRYYHTSGVRGTESARTALTKLLAESGLMYRVVSGTVQIRPAEKTQIIETSRPQVPIMAAQFTQAADPAARTATPSAPQASSSGATRSSTNGKSTDIEEEVVVTAQRGREQRLLETPISVGVLQGEQLDRSSARAMTDVLNQVGGVALTEIQPGRSNIVVRGVVSGSGITVEGGTNTTAYYLDEVPFGFARQDQMVDLNVFDLERVEVLRGPQGTLYGANSMSGVVRMITHDADLNDLEFKARTRASSTSDAGENYGIDAVVNVPLIPGELAVRAVAGYSDLSGFIDSRLGGQDINDTQAQNYRIKVGWQPTENLSAQLGYMRSDVHSGAPSMSLDDLTTPFSANQPDDRVMDMYSLVAQYRWPSVSLLSSTGYITYDAKTRREIFLFSTTVPNGFLNRDRLISSFSQEFRLLSALEGPWQWSAGAYYKETQQERFQRLESSPLAALSGSFIQGATSESAAVFADVTRSFSDGRFDVTAGLRYFKDEETIEDLGSLNPASVLAADSTEEFTKTTGRLVLSYKPHDDFMLYGSAATGFRSGQQQAFEVLRIATFDPVLPDSLLSYEIGTKGRLFGRALMYDIAVYYMEWEDILQSITLPPPTQFGVRVNGGEASGPGVDATFSYQPVNSLTLHASLGWNDLTFNDDVFNTYSGVRLFTEGSRLNNSPEWTGSLGADFRTPMGKAGMDFLMSANFAYGSTRKLSFLSGGVVRETESESMRLLKASMGIASERWTAELYADNVLDDDSQVTPEDSSAANTSVRLRPLTIGLQLTFEY